MPTASGSSVSQRRTLRALQVMETTLYRTIDGFGIQEDCDGADWGIDDLLEIVEG